MTVYSVISLPKIPYTRRVYMVLAIPTHWSLSSCTVCMCMRMCMYVYGPYIPKVYVYGPYIPKVFLSKILNKHIHAYIHMYVYMSGTLRCYDANFTWAYTRHIRQDAHTKAHMYICKCTTHTRTHTHTHTARTNLHTHIQAHTHTHAHLHGELAERQLPGLVARAFPLAGLLFWPHLKAIIYTNMKNIQKEPLVAHSCIITQLVHEKYTKRLHTLVS